MRSQSHKTNTIIITEAGKICGVQFSQAFCNIVFRFIGNKHGHGSSRCMHKHQKIERLFYFLLVQSPITRRHELRERFSCSMQVFETIQYLASYKKWYLIAPPRWNPVIQPLFNSSSGALQYYETGMKILHRAIRKSHDLNNQAQTQAPMVNHG